MTLGDVLAVLATVVSLVVTGMAVVLAAALLFPAATGRAQRQLQFRPWLSLGVGVIVGLVGGFPALVLLALPHPGAKLCGGFLLSLLGTRVVVGAAGVVQVMADHIRDRSPSVSPFAALSYSGGLFVVAFLFPCFGWLFLLPIAVLWSLGAGVTALRWGPEPRRPMLESDLPVVQAVSQTSAREPGVVP
ncbi:MAG: hypothetical protein IT429_20475 [Gemmataceae bacterium]|nr:hypothetical protein [Gemmataceae bacterium]